MSHDSKSNPTMVDVFSDSMLETVKTCPVCACEDAELAVVAVDNLFFCSPRKWRYLRCANCASIYLGNRPKPDAIHLAYRTYYTHSSTTGSVNLQVINLLRRYLRGSREGALSSGLIGLLKPLQSFFEAKTRGIANFSPGKVFDFGCGNGSFLSLCREFGWSAHGADFDESAVQTARAQGLDVVLGGIDALATQPDDSFDLITLSHVIEHLHEPMELLVECRKKLKSGGTLWIETPNANATGLHRFGKNWRGLEPPRHLLLFTMKSLSRALSAAQFSSIQVKSHFLSGVYTFVKSTALQNGGAGKCKYSMAGAVLHGLANDFKAIFESEASEFLTLTCKK